MPAPAASAVASDAALTTAANDAIAILVNIVIATSSV
jgi:hypothetical protein